MATIGEADDVADALDIASLIEPSPPQLLRKILRIGAAEAFFDRTRRLTCLVERLGALDRRL